MKNGWIGWLFFPKNWYFPALAIRLYRGSIKKYRLQIWRIAYLYLNFSRLAFFFFFCRFRQKIEPSRGKYLTWTTNCIWSFISTCIKRPFQMESKKSKHGKGMMLIRTFFLKGINNDRKIFTHNEIIDRIVEQIVQLIKIVDSSKHTAVKSLIYLFI